MGLLGLARLLIWSVPLHRWKSSLGYSGQPRSASRAERSLAAMVERAAQRVPFETKCLPRAMALSWMLRRRKVPHTVVFAVRPEARRDSTDQLHAWVEAAGIKLLGDLPGPWLVMLRLGE